MKKPTVRIDGQLLRVWITERCGGKRQKQIATELGCSEFALSRWMAPGVRHITKENAERLATYCGVTLDALLTECGPRNDAAQKTGSGLTPSEQYWLDLYRGLSPGEQAKAMTMVMNFVDSLNQTSA